eukprot:3678-Heterococcus_DN1.PRE.4
MSCIIFSSLAELTLAAYHVYTKLIIDSKWPTAHSHLDTDCRHAYRVCEPDHRSVLCITRQNNAIKMNLVTSWHCTSHSSAKGPQGSRVEIAFSR